MHFTGNEYLKNGFEMLQLFKNSIDEEIVKESVLFSPMEIFSKISDYKILNNTSSKLPTYKIPDGHTKESYLKELVFNGIKKRYKTETPEIKQRTQHELDVIFNLGFADYFLIVWDFIKFAKEREIAVGPGRGSAAGSIIAFALEITDIDPIKYNLLFERFLISKQI